MGWCAMCLEVGLLNSLGRGAEGMMKLVPCLWVVFDGHWDSGGVWQVGGWLSSACGNVGMWECAEVVLIGKK